MSKVTPVKFAFALAKLFAWLVAALIAALALVWSNCAQADDWTLAFELGAEFTRRNESLRGDDPLMYAMLRVEHDTGVFVYWRHQSSIFTGWPWNGNKDQMWVDTFGVAYRWELGRW